jgi:hypothetical protein
MNSPCFRLLGIQHFFISARLTDGTLLNSRQILVVYVLLQILLSSSLSFVTVGYPTFEMASVFLDANVNESCDWHFWYSLAHGLY